MKCSPIPELTNKDIARFWSYVDRCGPDDCWPWTGGVCGAERGNFSIGGATFAAHRVAYKIKHGAVSDLCVCHSCDWGRCCNPAHLWQGTIDQNNDDRNAKGRQVKGVRHALAKLSEPQVLAIRNDHRILREIAEQYGVTFGTVWKIQTRRIWRHLA